MLDLAKATFYHEKITACGQDSNFKSLFRPDMDSTINMANAFSNDEVIQICESLGEMDASGSFVVADSHYLVNFQGCNRR